MFHISRGGYSLAGPGNNIERCVRLLGEVKLTTKPRFKQSVHNLEVELNPLHLKTTIKEINKMNTNFVVRLTLPFSLVHIKGCHRAFEVPDVCQTMRS